jgi:aryl carrier-like protein
MVPEYMVPAAFVRLDKLPLTANGKVDRRALSEVVEVEKPARSVVPPRNEVEGQLLRIWQDALGVAEIGVEDNFFELGGDSVLIVRMHKQLKALYGERISVVDLFRYPKIAALAAYLADTADAPAAAAPAAAAAAASEAAQVDRRKAAMQRQRQLAMNGADS